MEIQVFPSRRCESYARFVGVFLVWCVDKHLFVVTWWEFALWLPKATLTASTRLFPPTRITEHEGVWSYIVLRCWGRGGGLEEGA